MHTSTKRSAAACLFLTLLAAIATLQPSQAATASTLHSYTQDGWTATWSESDYDDLQISKTSGKADSTSHSRDAEIGQIVIDTWVDIHEDSENLAAFGAPNGCTKVPDGYGAANFKPACDKHDICYGSSTDRIDCDKKLRSNLKAACKAAYPNLTLPTVAEDYNKCMAMSTTYYEGVRKLGKKHYAGSGDPA